MCRVMTEAGAGTGGPTRRDRHSIGPVGTRTLVLVAALLVVPAVVAGVVTGAAAPDAGAAPSGNATADRSAGELQAITADTQPDEETALAATGDGYLLVWERRAEGKTPKQGKDVFWSRYSDGEWSRPRPITDDGMFDTTPSVAYDPERDRGIAVWTKVTHALGEDEKRRDIARYLNRTEVYYAIYEDGSWSEPTRLTNNERLDVVPRVVATGGAFHVGWQRIGEAGAASGQLLHTDVTAEGAGEVRAFALPSGAWDMSAGPDGGIRVAYLKTDQPRSRNGTVVVAAGADELSPVERYEVTGMTGMDLTRDAVGWVTGAVPGTSPKIYYAEGGDVERVPFTRPVQDAGDLQLATTGNDTVVVYRGLVPINDTRRVFYKVRRGDRWLFDQAVNRTALSDFSVSDLVVASNRDDLGIVFSVSKQLSQPGDLIGLVRKYRPDLVVNASATPDAANVSIGESTTVSYSVGNTGDLDLTDEFTVRLTSGSDTVASETFDGVPVGGHVNGSFETTVPESGSLSVEVDPENEIPELVEDNNVETVVLAGPDLTVTNISAESGDGEITVTATVENVGQVDSGGYEVTLETPDFDVLASRSFAGLAAGERKRIELTGSTERIEGGTILVAVNASDDIVRANNVRAARTGTPEIAVWENVEFGNVDGQLVANVTVANRGPGPVRVPVAVQYPGNETVIAASNVTIDPPRDSEVTTKQVQFELPASRSGRRIQVFADVDDRDGTNNAILVRVPSMAPFDTTPPEITTFEATVSNGTLRVQVVASEPLDVSGLTVRASGPATVTLGGEAFRETDDLTYVATAPLNSSGSYTVELASAPDPAGNDGAGSAAPVTVTVESGNGGGGGGGTLILVVVVLLVLVGVAGAGYWNLTR